MIRGINTHEPTLIPHSIDRADWGSGPWDGEPDRVEWRYKGVPCLIVRNQLGGLCGYAAVPPTHAWYGKDYSHGCLSSPVCGEDYCAHTPDSIVSIHGGLTYADACSGHVCHVPQPGEPDPVWWFGFDCGHFMDLLPGMVVTARKLGLPEGRAGAYRNVAYVRAEVERLAEQLLAVA